MQNPFADDAQAFSDDEMRLMELVRQFITLPHEGPFAGRIVILDAEGEYIGDAKLTPQAIAAATEALLKLHIQSGEDAKQVAAGIDALERLANGGEL